VSHTKIWIIKIGFEGEGTEGKKVMVKGKMR
jgi:hypothetical protein